MKTTRTESSRPTTAKLSALQERLCVEFADVVETRRMRDWVTTAAHGVALFGDSPDEHIEMIEMMARNWVAQYRADLARFEAFEK